MPMINLIKSGGVMMLPILACAIYATYVIIERCIFFYLTRNGDKIFIDQIKTILSSGKSNAVIQSQIQSSVNDRITQYGKHIDALGTVSGISTMLGLLGTVLGNIKAFNIMGASLTVDALALAGGIGTALITTVAGLCVCIPGTIFHNWFQTLIERRITRMECDINSLLAE